jgi:hypothetical protein
MAPFTQNLSLVIHYASMFSTRLGRLDVVRVVRSGGIAVGRTVAPSGFLLCRIISFDIFCGRVAWAGFVVGTELGWYFCAEPERT